MNVTADTVRALRERTGAGMMECKRALVETGGDLDAAAELMRKQGLAKADKKAARVAAEGVIVIERAADGRAAAMAEINCETDFVAREQDFRRFAADVARLTLEHRPVDLEALLNAELVAGESVDQHRRALVSKIGENISVRRCVVLERGAAPALAAIGAYVHGTRIGVLVALESTSGAQTVAALDTLAHDVAMHIAASNPRFIATSDVPADVVAKEREILAEQAQQQAQKEGKSPEVVAKMVEGRLRKSLNEFVLLGQPFVKELEQTVEKVLKAANARVVRFERYEVGAGMEKKQDNFVADVMAQVSAATKPTESEGPGGSGSSGSSGSSDGSGPPRKH
ncbi:MAG TPA: translation elongation factor Ts [Steroidobacteraceae bacterium]|jgi:elongation factor Ts|nr:translation elongation factor Ts [Steroidobacteraceae bacterium]